MTGYASAQSATEDGLAFTLSLKSVNHRFLDLNMRLPGETDGLEVTLRKLIKEQVKRGHLDVTLHVERRAREAAQAVQLNHELLGGVHAGVSGGGQAAPLQRGAGPEGAAAHAGGALLGCADGWPGPGAGCSR